MPRQWNARWPRLKDTHDLLAPPDGSGQRIVCAALVRKGLLAGEPEWLVGVPEGFRVESKGEDSQTTAIGVNIDTFSRPVLRFRIRPRDDHARVPRGAVEECGLWGRARLARLCEERRVLFGLTASIGPNGSPKARR